MPPESDAVTEHTPTPWRSRPSTSLGNFDIQGADSAEWVVAECFDYQPHPERAEANARFIVRAQMQARLETARQNARDAAAVGLGHIQRATAAEAALERARALLREFCGLFFGRDGDGSHITSEEYVKRHTELFTRVADQLRAWESKPPC